MKKKKRNQFYLKKKKYVILAPLEFFKNELSAEPLRCILMPLESGETLQSRLERKRKENERAPSLDFRIGVALLEWLQYCVSIGTKTRVVDSYALTLSALKSLKKKYL